MFRLRGIPIELHASFALIPLYFARQGWLDQRWSGIGWGLLTCVLVFACVTLHEMGHALAARRFNIQTLRILLLPFGGLAHFDQMPRTARQELLITLAGPAVNFLLAALLWPFTYELVELPPLPRDPADLVTLLALFNLVMGLFNLIPVFPMDGGRLLRAALSFRFGFRRATRWTASLGILLAVALGLYALFGLQNFLLATLFFFIMLASRFELRAAGG